MVRHGTPSLDHLVKWIASFAHAKWEISNVHELTVRLSTNYHVQTPRKSNDNVVLFVQIIMVLFCVLNKLNLWLLHSLKIDHQDRIIHTIEQTNVKQDKTDLKIDNPLEGDKKISSVNGESKENPICIPIRMNTIVFKSHAQASNSGYYQYAFQTKGTNRTTYLYSFMVKDGEHVFDHHIFQWYHQFKS